MESSKIIGPVRYDSCNRVYRYNRINIITLAKLHSCYSNTLLLTNNDSSRLLNYLLLMGACMRLRIRVMVAQPEPDMILILKLMHAPIRGSVT